jgi:hypothetical protein
VSAGGPDQNGQASPRRQAARAIVSAAGELLGLGHAELARRLAGIAQDTDPGFARARMLMADALDATGAFEAALVARREAVALAPEEPAPRLALARALLRAGALAEGLALREAVQGMGALPPAVRLAPGEALTGRRVLVVADGEPGELLWAARWLPRLVAAGARLSLSASHRLRLLLARQAPFVELLAAPAASPDAGPDLAALAARFDAVLPLTSLPWLLGVTAPDPAPPPWLRPDAGRIAAWRARFLDGFAPRRPARLVGLVWRGERDGVALPLPALAPLGAFEALGLVLLQPGPAERRREAAVVLPGAIDGLSADDPPLDDLAAALSATDRVVAVESVAMHLAGAAGTPTLVPAPHAMPGWLLGEGQPVSAWYPSLGVRRQGQGEAWAAVMARIGQELAGG